MIWLHAEQSHLHFLQLITTREQQTAMLLNQYSPVPRARSSIAGKDATRAQVYAGASTDLCRLRKRQWRHKTHMYVPI